MILRQYSTSADETKFHIVAHEWWRHPYLTQLSPIVALYLILALYQIGDQSLWVDEVLSVRFALSGDSLKSIWLNSQCPLYFTLLRAWSKVAGTTEFGLRMFSALLGAGAVWLTYAIALRLLNRRIAMVAALLLATSPFFVWYSQEVRYINLMLATSLLSTYSFHRAVTTDRLGWWLSYSAFSILATFSFVSVIFLFAGHGAYVLFHPSRRALLRNWILCHLGTFALFGGWFVAQYWQRLAPALARDSSLVARRVSEGTAQMLDLVATLPYTFFVLSAGFSIGPSVPELHTSRSFSSLLGHASVIVPIGIFFAVLLLLGLARLRQSRDAKTFLIFWFFFPILGTFLAATITTFAVYNVRYVAVALPAYLMLLAAAIVGFRRPGFQIVLVVSVLAINGVALSNYYFDDRYARADARAAAEYLKSTVPSGDAILAVGNTLALDYYYKGPISIERIDPGRAMGSDMADHLRLIIRAHRRLWLVEIRPWETDPKNTVRDALDKLARRRGNNEFPGVNVYTYSSYSSQAR